MPSAQRRSSFIDSDDPPSPVYTGKTGDKTIKFVLYYVHPGESKECAESYEQISADPEKWCRDIIDWFNSTLRPHERKRVFVRCEVIGEVPPAEHRGSRKPQ